MSLRLLGLLIRRISTSMSGIARGTAFDGAGTRGVGARGSCQLGRRSIGRIVSSGGLLSKLATVGNVSFCCGGVGNGGDC
jgi:hypothetical protein